MEGFFYGVRPKFFIFDVRFEILRENLLVRQGGIILKHRFTDTRNFRFFHFFQFLQHHIGREETDGVLKIVVR